MSFTPLTSSNNLDAATLNGRLTEIDTSQRKMQPGGVFGYRAEVTATTTVTLSPGIARDDTDTLDIKRTTASGAISMSLASGNGVNKLDTGSLAAETWYYIYAIAKADGTSAGLVSTSGTAPTMPSGYVYKRRVGMVRSNASAVLHRQQVLDEGVTRQIVYLENTNSPTGGFVIANGIDVSSATWDTINMASVVPPSARVAKVHVSASIATTNTQVYYRIHSAMQSRFLYQGTANERVPLVFDLPLTTSQTVDLKASGTATETLTIMVHGYTDNLVCNII